MISQLDVIDHASLTEAPPSPVRGPASGFGAPRRGLWWLAGVGVFGLTLCLMAMVLVSRLRRPPLPPPSLPVLFVVPPFALTNQDRQLVSSSNLLGQVWLADIVFTRCAGPCPKMTHRMSELQSALPPQAPVKLVTLTTDPAFDTPAVLQGYGRRFGASFDRWWFLTGDKRTLASLATDGLKFVAAEIPMAERRDAADLFLHSTFFVLVDQHGQARGVYYYSDPRMKERVLGDISRLLSET